MGLLHKLFAFIFPGVNADLDKLAHIDLSPKWPYPRIANTNGRLYARKGEWSYCAKGCRLARLNNDIFVGDTPKESDWTFKHFMSFGVVNCPRCEAPVMDGRGNYFMDSRFPRE